MNFTPEVEAMSAEAAAAVEALMSPALPPGERQRTYELCERLKESPLALQCGVFLSASHRPNMVRYLGLQIIENTIKFRWNDLSVEEKLFVKDACLDLMSSVDPSAPAHLRDALCRPLVEMVKREWPQQYAEFVPDMGRLAARGALHTELVLRVFLRLAEDVATFQTLEVPGRRRDIYRGLVGSMDDVFSLLMGTLTTCVSAPDGQDTALAEMCLNTLACYLEWAAVQHVMGDALLLLLLRLVTRPGLQQLAAECLVVLFSRHGRAEDREPLLVVFRSEPVCLLEQQVSICSGQPPSDALLATLRLLAQALAGAVSQLSYCWGRAELTVAEPPTLGRFLQVLLTLCQLPCGSVGDLLLPAWTALLRHSQAGRSETVLAVAPALFAWLQRRARRPADPAAEPWRYLEGEEDADRARPEAIETLRSLAAAAPAATFALLCEGVSQLVSAPLASDAGPPRLPAGSDTLKDWSTAVYLTDHVAPRAAELPEQAERGSALLGVCLGRRSADPQVLSLLVSLVSSLTAFLPRCPHQTPAVLERLFEAVTFPPESETDRAGRDLRRHGCNALLALAVRQPAALGAHWALLAGRVRELLAEPGRLGAQEGVTLTELLVLVHARIGDYQQQSELIGALLEPHLTAWQALAEVCRSPAALMTAVGLDAPPPPLLSSAETSADVERQQARSQLTLLVNLLSSVLLRCRVPDDPDRRRDGGFLDPATGAVRNPCAPHILPRLPLIFQLLRALSALDSPENVARLHPELRGALQLSAPVKLALLSAQPEKASGDSGSNGQRSPLERIQGFISYLYETCHGVLVNAANTLPAELFAVPRLSDYLAGSVLHCLPHLSDHRLRVQLRSLWRTLLLRCPAELLEQQLLPPLAVLLDHLVERLDTRWAAVQAAAAAAPAAGEEQEEEDTEAVLAELLLRQVTRESVQLATCLLTAAGTGATITASADDDTMEEDAPSAPAAPGKAAVSAAGLAALRCPQLARPLLTLVFRTVGWGDSVAALKASDLALLLVKAMTDAELVDDAAASQVLYWLLHGLEVQGHHMANFTSLVTSITAAYVRLRPNHTTAVDTVMSQIPEVTPEMVRTLEERVFRTPKIAASDKLKKEEVKRVIKPLVSRSLSQLFQKKASIRNLLPLPNKTRPERAAVDMVSLADLFGDS
ncbi:exportin-5-like [Amphibalanus amphitrite]|uniref:exportin-5-like n=1 Tax=Amphibalanus amphitrite TaxID=1232801 RepID=UPI001C923DE3|nr:exportin-5-like [Amphibalanus amphitrite]